jgi:hypothetical protein
LRSIALLESFNYVAFNAFESNKFIANILKLFKLNKIAANMLRLFKLKFESESESESEIIIILLSLSLDDELVLFNLRLLGKGIFIVPEVKGLL